MSTPLSKPAKKKPAKRTPAKMVKASDPATAALDVFDPAYEAHKLRMRGMPWREVAIRTGYDSESAAVLAVGHYVSKAATAIDIAQKREALAMQLQRYEAVLDAWWSAGVPPTTASGVALASLDEKAANVVLKTLAQIDKLHHFDTEESGTAAPEVIVIGGDPAQYAAGLRAVVEAESD